MLIPALLAAATASAVIDGLPPEVAGFAQEASGWLLEGRDLPRDYRLRLLQMSPADRLQALIFLRRAGLLTGQSWPLADILRPSQPDPEALK